MLSSNQTVPEERCYSTATVQTSLIHAAKSMDGEAPAEYRISTTQNDGLLTGYSNTSELRASYLSPPIYVICPGQRQLVL